MKLLSSDARNVAAFAISSGQGFPSTPHRHAGQKARPELLLLLVSLQQAIKAWCVYRAGTDGVDADPALLQIYRPGARKRAHGCLGCVVDTKSANPLGCGHRGIQNDGAAAAAILKQRKRLLHGEQKPFDVDAECFVEVSFGNFPQWGQFPNAGVGEQDVDVALLSLLHSGIQPVKVRKV
jgi:hypothetical protein